MMAIDVSVTTTSKAVVMEITSNLCFVAVPISNEQSQHNTNRVYAIETYRLVINYQMVE